MDADKGKPYLWIGSIEGFGELIDYVNGKQTVFSGWAGCSFLHKEINFVVGKAYGKSFKQSQNYKHPEVRSYANSWMNIRKHYLHKYKECAMHITVERMIPYTSINENEEYNFRMDALILCLKVDDTRGLTCINVIVVEYKHKLSEDKPIETFEKDRERVRDYHNAVKKNLHSYVNVTVITDVPHCYVVQPANMLFACSKCAIEARNHSKHVENIVFECVDYKGFKQPRCKLHPIVQEIKQ